MLPYTFLVELMGDRATLRQDLLQWLDTPIDLETLAAANPFPDVRLAGGDRCVRPAGDPHRLHDARVRPTSAHHPFQAEIDELVSPACSRIATRRSTSSTRRRRWRCAWRRIGRRSSAASRSRCR